MADWVATVALGKLSDVQGDREKSNLLWAIWAPLLLLHLGGPDTITAYSLEDNQLWMRHLLGLVVQLFVAIYVILMSWKNSWFSFMSLPALVAGVIKYLERTSVLKWVSDDKYLNRIPVHPLNYRSSTEGHDYVRVLLLAHKHLLQFIIYLREGGVVDAVGFGMDLLNSNHPLEIKETNIQWDSLEIQMGLVYEWLYTKSAVIYSKRGFIMRGISFGCTVSVLVGLTIQIVLLRAREEDDEKNWHEIDIAITGVLITGAVALEIYAAVVLFSSNWMMLWLSEHGMKEWVIWLSQRFPCLFNKKKKYWSQMMGQFDLIGYWLKVGETGVQSPSRKIIRLVLGRNYEDKWNRYRHKTACSVYPLVHKAILTLRDPFYDSIRSGNLTSDMNKVWVILKDRNITGDVFSDIIETMHLAIEICYHLESEWDAGGEDDPSGSDSSSWKQNREVSKALSDYMMYLLILHPSLLPNVVSLGFLEKELHNPGIRIGDARDVKAVCHNLLMDFEGHTWSWSRIVTYLKGKNKAGRWALIKQMWLMLLCDATSSGKVHPCSVHSLGRQGMMDELRQGDKDSIPTYDESVPPSSESKDVKLDLILADRMAKNQNDDIVQDEVPDEGWQEAFPKGRSTTNRKSSSSMSTNFRNVSQSTIPVFGSVPMVGFKFQ
ncbi:hypothetical protein RHGRI_000184 [Rhododendron griersonianum]|uniref:DUF4220 domain-containing protein n=1 Tax=Rhododendron griersonianum TaxID=479676 RepID=A0AAV6LGR9_9ERIC|nr:hypothetical protein RHGRI_000184 [Rhododendron griersonianum]